VGSGSSNGHSTKLFETARASAWSADGADLTGRAPTAKRKKGMVSSAAVAVADSDEDDDDSNAAPVNDIYRKRQQKKMR
jgi:hypothetical protein